MPTPLSWVEVSADALRHNISQLRELVGATRLAPVVKANAYGHGLELAARVFADAGADWLCVNALFEARRVREAGLDLPIYILGHVPAEDMQEASSLGCHVVVYTSDVVEAGARARDPAQLHLKLETGNNRQGLQPQEALELARQIQAAPGVSLAGLTTHFADVEDTTDHSFAREQVDRFERFRDRLRDEGIAPGLCHVSNSAATILWQHAHMDLVRAGIACYGMWPSTEAYVAALMMDRAAVDLRPALCWKTRVAQVRRVQAGEFVGYGRTFCTTHAGKLAVLPVGYYDGYDRKLSNLAYVLIRGRRAQIRGRVCMNLIMVDVTDVPGVQPGDEVVLLGQQGEEQITAEQMATWAGTINYEITTRINDGLARVEA